MRSWIANLLRGVQKQAQAAVNRHGYRFAPIATPRITSLATHIAFRAIQTKIPSDAVFRVTEVQIPPDALFKVPQREIPSDALFMPTAVYTLLEQTFRRTDRRPLEWALYTRPN